MLIFIGRPPSSLKTTDFVDFDLHRSGRLQLNPETPRVRATRWRRPSTTSLPPPWRMEMRKAGKGSGEQTVCGYTIRRSTGAARVM